MSEFRNLTVFGNTNNQDNHKIYKLDQNRVNHIYGVAKNCYHIAKVFGEAEEFAREMFTLGMLHDVGYSFAEPKDHAKVGGDVAKRVSFSYHDDISKHGIYTSDGAIPIDIKTPSKALTILDLADFLTNSDGSIVTAKERIEGMVERYGEGSIPHFLSQFMYKKYENWLGDYHFFMELNKQIETCETTFSYPPLGSSEEENPLFDLQGLCNVAGVTYVECGTEVVLAWDVTICRFTLGRKSTITVAKSLTYENKRKLVNSCLNFMLGVSLDHPVWQAEGDANAKTVLEFVCKENEDFNQLVSEQELKFTL